MQWSYVWTILHEYEFEGWSQLDIRQSDTEGEGL